MEKPRGIDTHLGYNIKYVDPLPGNKLKRPIYEIKPGKWVSRGKVPEHRRKRKLRRVMSRDKDAANWKIYYAKNKNEIQKKKKKYRAENKDHCRKLSNKWNNSEKGFITNLYSSALKESKKGRRGKKIPFEFTTKTWWEHWKKQKKKYGMRCPYTKVLMTTKRGEGRGTPGGVKRTPTNISKDQIWPGRGYTPTNLIFCTVKFNDNKKSITPDGCEAVIDVHKERMDDWANEIALKKELRKIDVSRPENIKHYRKELRKFRRSVSEKEYQRYLEITYQRSVAEKGITP